MIHNNHIKYLIAVFVFFGMVFLPMDFVQAHPGGLNKYGCHAGKEPYHCHGGSSSGSGRGDDDVCVLEVILVLGVLIWLISSLVDLDDEVGDLRNMGNGEILPVYDTENDRIGIRYRMGF